MNDNSDGVLILMKRLLIFFILIVPVMQGQPVMAETIPIHALDKAPAVDGKDDDWGAVPGISVALRPTVSNSAISLKSASVKGGTHGNRLYLFIEWEDATKDIIHKPWKWSDETKKYQLGPEREDRLAVQFGMQGDYTTNWLAGNDFIADTWHWKASRSNPLGLAHDKSLIISRTKLMRAYNLKLPDGSHVYVSRPSDAGDKLYKTKRYRRFVEQVMPKYILTESPQGSVSDVAAKGIWSEGRWRVELSRDLETGNDDDRDFPLSQGIVSGGIAIFDRSENNDHVISDTLTFDFRYQPWLAN